MCDYNDIKYLIIIIILFEPTATQFFFTYLPLDFYNALNRGITFDSSSK